MALELVRQLLETIGRRSLPQGQGDILNVLDHLVPYYLGFAAAVLAVGLATIGAYALIVLAARMGRRNVLSEAPRR